MRFRSTGIRRRLRTRSGRWERWPRWGSTRSSWKGSARRTCGPSGPPAPTSRCDAMASGFACERTWATLVEATRRCTAIARDAGLLLCLEPRVGELVSNTDALLRLSQQVDDPGFGVVLDTGHLHAQKEILPLSVEKLGQR